MRKRLLLYVALLRCQYNKVNAHDPLALHHLYDVAPGEEIVISLRGHDLDGDQVSFSVFKRIGVQCSL